MPRRNARQPADRGTWLRRWPRNGAWRAYRQGPNRLSSFRRASACLSSPGSAASPMSADFRILAGRVVGAEQGVELGLGAGLALLGTDPVGVRRAEVVAEVRVLLVDRRVGAFVGAGDRSVRRVVPAHPAAVQVLETLGTVHVPRDRARQFIERRAATPALERRHQGIPTISVCEPRISMRSPSIQFSMPSASMVSRQRTESFRSW